ncbi:MAG: DUF2062 domain-containing protein [Desulfuromonas sp.]|nr:DUF2062 domain-containing protein [Desulfuromonas sp.]
MWRGIGFFRQCKLMLVRFVRLRGLPEEIAKGMALGIFIGMTPTMGFQMPIALIFASVFRENRLAAVIGVWITNPATAPFIYGLEYEIGRLLLGMGYVEFPNELTVESVMKMGWEVIAPLWLGGILAGIALAPIAYWLTLRLVPIFKTWRPRRWPRRQWHRKHKHRVNTY